MRRILAVVICLIAADAPADEPTTLKLVQTIPLAGKPGRFDHLALDTTRDRLLVANLSNDSLDVVDLTAGKLTKQITGQKKAQGVAFAPALDRIYQGNGTAGVCNVFDGTTFETLHTLKLPDADNVRFDPASGLVYVGHGDKALTAFDATTYTVKATIPLPGPPESFQIDAGRKRLYVNCLRPATVAVIDLATHAVVARWPLTLADANYPLALDVKGRRLFVGCRKKPMVVVLDAATGKELAGVDIPGDTDDLFYDPALKRLYVSCGEGFVDVIERHEADHYQLRERIPTRSGARTSFFSAELNEFYLAVPQRGQHDAEIRVFQPQE